VVLFIPQSDFAGVPELAHGFQPGDISGG
jgi:hypothetical protein